MMCREPGHYCVICHPEYLTMTFEPMHEGHLAARFGDKARGRWRLLFDGNDVTDRATECVLGPNGWVYLKGLHADGATRVHCPGGVCMAVLHGDVRLIPLREAV